MQSLDKPVILENGIAMIVQRGLDFDRDYRSDGTEEGTQLLIRFPRENIRMKTAANQKFMLMVAVCQFD